MGCHGNGAISNSPNQVFFFGGGGQFVSHLVGPSEQFGTHEKLAWMGVQGRSN